MAENDQATRGLANGSRRARSFIQQCDLPDVLSRPARDQCRASPFDSHLALHDHKELVAPLALSSGDLAGRFELSSRLVPVRDTRSLSKADMPENDVCPDVRVDPDTFAVTIDGELVEADPATELPMAQRYFLF